MTKSFDEGLVTNLRAYIKNKPQCIVVGDNVIIDGDLSFTRNNFGEFVGDFTHWYEATGCNNLTITNCYHTSIPPKLKQFKLWFLWFWHMNILRKDAVYLTGVLRNNTKF